MKWVDVRSSHVKVNPNTRICTCTCIPVCISGLMGLRIKLVSTNAFVCLHSRFRITVIITGCKRRVCFACRCPPLSPTTTQRQHSPTTTTNSFFFFLCVCVLVYFGNIVTAEVVDYRTSSELFALEVCLARSTALGTTAAPFPPLPFL
jgi:hypothetical protein